MKKIISILSLLAFFNIHLISQVTLTIPDQTIANNATTLSVPVLIKADYPIAVIGWQFFIEWDETALTFQSISDIENPTLRVQDFGMPNQTGKNNQLSFVWENYPENIALTGESQWFMLHFQVNSTASNTAISFCQGCSNEMYKNDLEAVQLFYQNSHITFGGNLPLSLLHFTAKKIDNEAVLLNWQTTNDLHTKHFDIQKSQDGLLWLTIGKIDVHDANITTKGYDFKDKNIQVPATYYYRLKMKDEDGKTAHSEIEVVNFKNIENTIDLFPNPTTKECYLVLKDPILSAVDISIFNAYGQVVSHFLASEKQIQIDTKAWISGLYYIQVIQDEKTSLLRLVKD